MIDQPQDSAQRITYLDVVEQQLSSMKQQALATIASCESAITTVQLLRAQAESARQIADERRKQQQGDVKLPATFGARRRQEASGNGDAEG